VKGAAYCAGFISLEAIQAVYFGSVLQRMDSFLVGAVVFSISSGFCLGWVAITQPRQFKVLKREAVIMLKAGLVTAVAWVTYFIAVELLEPAVVFTVFSGLMPITVVLAARLGVREASPAAGRLSILGYALIAIDLAYLCAGALWGTTGFGRGGFFGALVGVSATLATGVSTTWITFYCRRLENKGVEANSQFAFRYLPYVAFCVFGWLLRLDTKGPVAIGDAAQILAIGVLLIALPAYLVQRAIHLVSPLFVAVAGAVGPFIVFALQGVEGRVSYSNWTLTGLIGYSLASLILAAGEAHTRPAKVPPHRWHVRR
jgi:hypothetical protein